MDNYTKFNINDDGPIKIEKAAKMPIVIEDTVSTLTLCTDLDASSNQIIEKSALDRSMPEI